MFYFYNIAYTACPDYWAGCVKTMGSACGLMSERLRSVARADV